MKNNKEKYLVPVFDNSMPRYLNDLGFKIDHIETIYNEDGTKKRVAMFVYQNGIYNGIQQFLNRRDKMNHKKEKNTKQK